MTIAEVHGKISSTGRNLHDQMEDLLTSDVFSACKYLRPTTLLVPFLKKARSLNDESPLVPNQIHCATYHFWPRLARFEPDVLIALERDDRIWMVLIEAKYLSGKSGGPMDEEELSIASAPSDQLAGEYYDLLTAEDRVGLPPDRIVSRALIYLTAHRSMPTEDLQRSIAEASGGRFLTAGTADELREALRLTAGTSYRVSRGGAPPGLRSCNTKSTVIATGTTA